MKTLNEVIKAFEICIGCYCSNAEHDVCPYFGESDMGCMKEPEKDALHYLKEYRETVTKCNELKTGIWIPVDSETVNGRCSVCGYESHLYENDVYGEHYCPNCGAWLRLT